MSICGQRYAAGGKHDQEEAEYTEVSTAMIDRQDGSRARPDERRHGFEVGRHDHRSRERLPGGHDAEPR